MVSQNLGYLLCVNITVTWASEERTKDSFEWTSACLHCEI